MKKRDIALALAGGAAAAVVVKMTSRAKTSGWHADLPHADRSHFVHIDGAAVHYQEFGNAADKTLLLIHGFGSSTFTWAETAPKLAARGFHIVAVDMLGFGYSDKPAWFDYSITSQARVIERFMDRLGIGRAAVVGSSYGGAVSLSLALDYPERVEKLVLVGAVSNDEALSHPILRLASLPGVGELITPFLVDSKIFARMRMRETIAVSNHHLVNEYRLSNVRRPLLAADAHHSLLTTSRNWDANRIERDAERLMQPTLLIWGDSDTVIPIHNAYKLHELILNSRFVVLKDCGHIPMEEKPELFVELTTEFCNDEKGRLAKKANDDVAYE